MIHWALLLPALLVVQLLALDAQALSLGMASAARRQVDKLAAQVAEDRAAKAAQPVHHQGDLVVGGAQVVEITGRTYYLHGDLVVRDQGVLRITDSTFIHDAGGVFAWQASVQDQGRLEITRSTVHSNGHFIWWRLLGQGQCACDQADFPQPDIHLWCLGSARLTAANDSRLIVFQRESSEVTLTASPRAVLHAPETPENGPPTLDPSLAAVWEDPVPVNYPVNTPLPADALGIGADGQTLYFFFARGTMEELGVAAYLTEPTGTYAASRAGGPADFGRPAFFNLGLGARDNLSADGECSFTSDGGKVYFHSLRGDNTGYQLATPVDDFLDIYVADIVSGVPGPGRNLGVPVNSASIDGEHGLYDDHTLYLASARGGDTDLWKTVFNGTAWSDPVNLGPPVNSTGASELQPVFTSDGSTMYFTRKDNAAPGIYRSLTTTSGGWGEPALVVSGLCGEPTLTADGQYLYFVHVWAVWTGGFRTLDSDVYYLKRK